MILLSELIRFPTRRRSSNPLWAGWVAVLVVAIVVAQLFAVVLLRTVTNTDVRFVNLRTATFAGLRKEAIAREVTVDDSTPVLMLGSQHVVLGRARSISQPQPDGDVVLLAREGWREQLPQRVAAWRNAKTLFPARVVGLAVNTAALTAMELLDTVRQVEEIFGAINRSQGGEVPVVVLVRGAGG